MTCDHHVYYDEAYLNVDDLLDILKKNRINKAILSPPCTKGKEPKKSELMYSFQRKLLSNEYGYFFSKLISNSFYNDKNELKLFWKIFSGNKNLKKIINPTNDILYSKIINSENLNMWYWINPNSSIKLNEHQNKIEKMKNKIFGFKFHLYWHNFEISRLLEYQELANKYGFPIYIILDYIDTVELEYFLKNNKFKKILFGYGGFPMFNKCWQKIINFENCFIDLASNHIDNNIINKILHIFPIDRVIFSTDCPYNFEDKNNIFDYQLFKNRINSDKFNALVKNKL